ncbi:telomeric repeat binding factor a isoform X2 [Pempheris klunzingeri]|uniref:telomeric repeat binding factor a isoform X2 n=1 Tax=Pempheris klunzingeri TaxID=3127111 RepID=UPI00397FEB2D
MAAALNKNNHQSDVESVVNRWVADYYMYHVLELFRQEQHLDFEGVRDVLDSVLGRPVEATDAMPTKIRMVQYLSRINEGEKLDLYFESDQSVTPLESALTLLENISQEINIPQQDFENVYISLTDMIVRILIRNSEFDKANEVLNKHFPKPVVGKKAIFMELIRQKSKKHEVIDQIDFQQFKEEMLAFCLKLCPFNVPFLHKAAEQLINKRLTEPDNESSGCDGQEEPGPSSAPQVITVPFIPSEHTIIQRSRLEMAYKALTAGSKERTFAQLEEEMEREEQARKPAPLPSLKKGTNWDSEQNGPFQRDSGSPLEASPAEQPPQTDAVPQTQASSLSKKLSVLRNRPLYTVARLVVEEDSQRSSQCSTASQALLTNRTEEPPQSEARPDEEDLQNPVTDSEVPKPTRKRPRKTSKRRRALTKSSADSEGDLPDSVASRETCVEKLHNQSKASLRSHAKSQQSSDNDEDSSSVRTSQEQLDSNPLSKDPGNTGEACIADSSLESSPELFPPRPVPQTSSTPHKDSAQDKDPSHSKWKRLCRTAKESKDTWSDEESYFSTRKSGSHNESTVSNSGHKKKKWTESETDMLKEGVKKFGEGNWSKIRAYYSFKDRTNVNIKDRWRTLKKLKLV